MELSKDNNVFLFGYRYLVNNIDSLPQGLCQLFWGGILGFILFVVTPILNIVTFIKSRIGTKRSFISQMGLDSNTGGIGRFFIQLAIIALYLLFVILVTPDMETFNDVPMWAWIWGWILPLIGVFSFTGVIVGIITFFVWLSNKGQSQNVKIISEGVKSKFTKICPRITWR